MVGLLTWPAYGTWFAHPHRGWIDRGQRNPRSIPEPARSASYESEGRPQSAVRSAKTRCLKWPARRLTGVQRDLVIRDLARVADLRRFRLHLVVAAADHVHLLLECDQDRDIPRLVQLVKGALSRALTVAAGDTPATSTGGGPLLHHKWWTRQSSFVIIDDIETLTRVTEQLRSHDNTEATIWSSSGDRGE